MTLATTTGRSLMAWSTLALAACLFTSGCSDATIVSARVGNPGSTVRSESPDLVETVSNGDSTSADETTAAADSAIAGSPSETISPAEKPIVVPVEGSNPIDSKSGDSKPAETGTTAVSAKVEDRTFRSEGPDHALRVNFDDLDLLKILKMDPVTNDCVGKMPSWLKGLNGKKVRIRGFMKPGLVMTGIPQFMLVRDTGLCCFGPKGKIYDMIATTLKPPTTTDYIELRPFDVVGTFRIELLEEDGIIFGLYYLDDAQIIQR